MSINGLQQQYFANSLDGLTYLDVNGLSINGDDVNIDNLVPYTGATKNLDMGSKAIKTSYVPVTPNDVVNNLALNNAVASISGIISAYVVPYSGANDNTDLGTYTISTTAVPTVGKNLTNKTYVDTQDALKVNKSGDTMTGTLTVPNITTTGLSTASPSFTLGINGSNQIIKYANPVGVFSGSVSATKLPYGCSTNVLVDSLLSQSGTTITDSGNLTVAGTVDLTGGAITTTLTNTGWSSPYFTSTGGNNILSYTYASGQGVMTSIPSATSMAVFATGVTISGSYLMVITNFQTSSSLSAVSINIRQGSTYGGSTILQTINVSGSTSPQTLSFNFSTNPAYGVNLIFEVNAYAGASSSSLAYFNTITLSQLVTQLLQTNVVGKLNASKGVDVTGGLTNNGNFSNTGNITNSGNLTNSGLLIFPNANAKLSTPTTGGTGIGNRIVFWDNAGTEIPYAIGMASSTLWYSSPATQKWYNGQSGSAGVLRMELDSGGALTVKSAIISGDVDTIGYVKLQPSANLNNTGYVEFRVKVGSDYVRRGYIGYADSTKLYIRAEAGCELSLGCNDGTERLIIGTDGTIYQLVSANGGRGYFIQNFDKGVNCYAIQGLQVKTDGLGTIGGCYWFMNGFGRTDDGGAKTATLRNDVGDMRLQSVGGQGLRIDTIGNVLIEGKELICTKSVEYGQIRFVGGGYGCFIRNDGENTYWLLTNVNDTYGQWNGLRPFRINNGTGKVHIENGLNLLNIPQSDYEYGNRVLMLDSTNSVAFGSNVNRPTIEYPSVNWGGGLNIQNCFYRNNRASSINVRFRYSNYCASVGTQSVGIRVYSQSYGLYWYFTPANFSNITYAHTSFYFEININLNTIGFYTGWFDVYIYAISNVITDTNDQVYIGVTSASGMNW